MTRATLSILVLSQLVVGTTAPCAFAGIAQIFSDLKARARERSYDIRIAEETAQGSGARLHTAWTRWLPRLNLQFSQTRSLDVSLLTSGSLGPRLPELLNPVPVALTRWELALNVPIYQRSVHLGILQASAERDLNRERLQSRVGELDWRMRSLLGNYLLQVYKDATVETSIEIARKNLKEAQLRFELGQRTRVDVLRAQANLVSLESRRITFDQQKTSALSAFLEYTGLTAEDLQAAGLSSMVAQKEPELLRAINEFTLLDSIREKLAPFLGADEKAQSGSWRQAVEASSVYRTYVAQRELTFRQSANLVAQEWPGLDFRAATNRQTPTFSEVFSVNDRSYSVGLFLNIPLYLGGSVFSASREKAHAQQAERLRSEQEIARFFNRLDEQRLQILSLRTQLEAQQLNVAQNDEIVRLSFRSYQLEKGTLVELLGAQDALIESKINLARTKIDLAALTRQFAWNLGVSLE